MEQEDPNDPANADGDAEADTYVHAEAYAQAKTRSKPQAQAKAHSVPAPAPAIEATGTEVGTAAEQQAIADADTTRLVRAAQRGDEFAMATLLDTLTPFVGRLCAPIALADGEDATQEALIAVFRGLRSVRDPKALYGWVRVIAVREAVRLARRRGQESPAELADLPASGDAHAAVHVRDVLKRLSPEHRAILVLRELEGLDEREAASLLGISLGTAKSRLHRARARFKEVWSA